MPRPRPQPPAPLDLPEPAPQSGAWVGWVVYAAIALVGFGFGVWVGNQRPAAPTETAKANPPKDENPPEKQPKAPGPDGPDKSPKKEPNTPAKKEPPESKNPEPKKNETPPEPKKNGTPMAEPVLFADKIQPIFKSKCNLCHGDTKTPKGDLDLRTLASIAKGGETGKALVPGNLKESNIWVWIDEGQMPPPDKPQLRDDEKTLIKNWILSGGK